MELECVYPKDPSEASPYETRRSLRHVIFTAETHNFPTGQDAQNVAFTCDFSVPFVPPRALFSQIIILSPVCPLQVSHRSAVPPQGREVVSETSRALDREATSSPAPRGTASATCTYQVCQNVTLHSPHLRCEIVSSVNNVSFLTVHRSRLRSPLGV